MGWNFRCVRDDANKSVGDSLMRWTSAGVRLVVPGRKMPTLSTLAQATQRQAGAASAECQNTKCWAARTVGVPPTHDVRPMPKPSQHDETRPSGHRVLFRPACVVDVLRHRAPSNARTHSAPRTRHSSNGSGWDSMLDCSPRYLPHMAITFADPIRFTRDTACSPSDLENIRISSQCRVDDIALTPRYLR